MEHLAFMKKEWKFLEKIISGEKTIESRWYKNASTPWRRCEKGETVYFKNSGELVSVKAKVADVMYIPELNPKKIKQILNTYGKRIGIGNQDRANFLKMFKDKKYCILIFLKNPKKIKPFQINKAGFGNMAAWISTPNINSIKL